MTTKKFKKRNNAKTFKKSIFLKGRKYKMIPSTTPINIQILGKGFEPTKISSYTPTINEKLITIKSIPRSKLPEKLIKDSKIFEKAEIKWFCVDDLMKQKKEFRSYYQNIIDMIYEQREQIYIFIRKAQLHKRTRRRVNKYNRTLKAKK